MSEPNGGEGGRSSNGGTTFQRGSKQSIDLVEPIKEDVLLQNLDVLLEKGVPLPSWLKGSPTLVDMNTKECYEGTSCLSHLQRVLQEGMQQQSSSSSSTAAAPRSLDEMEGVSPNGTHVSFETGDDVFGASVGPGPPGSKQMDGAANLLGEGKVTEGDLEKYIQMRKQTDTSPPPSYQT